MKWYCSFIHKGEILSQSLDLVAGLHFWDVGFVWRAIAPRGVRLGPITLQWRSSLHNLATPTNTALNFLPRKAQCAYKGALLLALVLVELQNTCKKKLNRKMLERPNICYIFEKLRVQGCQIWHSHVSIPFNSSPQCKKSSLRHHFRRNSWKLGLHKAHAHFLFSPV